MCKKQMNNLERHKVDLNKVGFITAAALLAATVVGHALITCCAIRMNAVSRALINPCLIGLCPEIGERLLACCSPVKGEISLIRDACVVRSALKQSVENVLTSTAGPACLDLYMLTHSPEAVYSSCGNMLNWTARTCLRGLFLTQVAPATHLCIYRECLRNASLKVHSGIDTCTPSCMYTVAWVPGRPQRQRQTVH